jgi:hypothetical protein
MEMNFLVVVVAVVAAMVTCSQALTCYSCTGGQTGLDVTDTATKSWCGEPFKYDSTLISTDSGYIPVVNCNGVCVTQSHYSGSTGSTTITRSCSEATVRSGCERRVSDTDSTIHWTCIKTCKTDKCNDNSGAATLLPVAMLLLLSAVIPAISRRIL